MRICWAPVSPRFPVSSPTRSSELEASLPAPRSALLVAHPGHELLLHGWLHAELPRVFVLTDGSGREGVSRLDATTRLLQGAAVPSGGVYGRHRDTEIYDALLSGDTALFVNLAQELAKAFAGDGVERVVGDAAEGWNPIHDVFRLTVNAAAALAARDLARPVQVYEFALFAAPGPGPDPERAVGVSLSPREREAKREAAFHYVELDREVRWILERYGEDGYTREWLRPSSAAPGEYRPPDDPPVYERYGEFLARSGQLAQAIRYRDHLLPVAAALGDAARR